MRAIDGTTTVEAYCTSVELKEAADVTLGDCLTQANSGGDISREANDIIIRRAQSRTPNRLLIIYQQQQVPTRYNHLIQRWCVARVAHSERRVHRAAK